MFTKAELLEQYKTLTLKPLHFLRVERFNHITRPHVWLECGYSVYRGNTSDFDNAAQFYCNCLIEWHAEGQNYETWKDGWRGWLTTEIDDALCLTIAKHEFRSLIERTLNQVVDLVQLPCMSDFVAALQMEYEWSHVGILAEFKGEFLYVNWHTGL